MTEKKTLQFLEGEIQRLQNELESTKAIIQQRKDAHIALTRHLKAKIFDCKSEIKIIPMRKQSTLSKMLAEHFAAVQEIQNETLKQSKVIQLEYEKRAAGLNLQFESTDNKPYSNSSDDITQEILKNQSKREEIIQKALAGYKEEIVEYRKRLVKLENELVKSKEMLEESRQLTQIRLAEDSNQRYIREHSIEEKNNLLLKEKADKIAELTKAQKEEYEKLMDLRNQLDDERERQMKYRKLIASCPLEFGQNESELAKEIAKVKEEKRKEQDEEKERGELSEKALNLSIKQNDDLVLEIDKKEGLIEMLEMKNKALKEEIRKVNRRIYGKAAKISEI